VLALEQSVSAVAHEGVAGIGVDFTSCTVLPVTGECVPLCKLERWRSHPHAWPKLWKHHAAQPVADRLTDVALERQESFIGRYGGRISSEWYFPKLIELWLEDREDYDAAVERIDEMERRLASDQVATYVRGADGARWESNVTKGQYEAMVDAAKEHIIAGDAFQIVLSQRFRKPLEASPFDLYRCLRAINPSPYMFFLCLGGDRHVVGTSPEKLVQVEGRRVETRPLAGTRRRGADPAEDSRLEKELLGLYLSDHPLRRISAELAKLSDTQAVEVTSALQDTEVRVAGLVREVRRVVTRKGQIMAYASLEDLTGTVDIVLFPRIFEQVRLLFEPDKVVVVQGKVYARAGSTRASGSSAFSIRIPGRRSGLGSHRRTRSSSATASVIATASPRRRKRPARAMRWSCSPATCTDCRWWPAR